MREIVAAGLMLLVGVQGWAADTDLLVWKHGDAVVAFTHTPVKDHAEGQVFICQLTIASGKEALRALFDLASDVEGGDPELFREVTSGAEVTGP